MDNTKQNSKLPEGWSWTTLGELGIVVSGGTPSTKEPLFWEGDITWVTPADLSDYKGKYLRKGARKITQLGLDNSSAVLLPKGSLLFSSRAPIGYVVIALNELATSQGFKNLIPVPSTYVDFLYFFNLAVTVEPCFSDTFPCFCRYLTFRICFDQYGTTI